MEVVLPTLLDEAVLKLNVPSRPSTNCNDWDAAEASFTCAAEAEFFKSPRRVAKADCAVVRLPELSAPPRVDKSAVSFALVAAVLPVDVAEFWKSACSV
jgi:hypothetical protein